MEFINKLLKWLSGKKTYIYGTISLIIGAIGLLTNSELWGMLENVDKTTEILLTINGVLVNLLRWLTTFTYQGQKK